MGRAIIIGDVHGCRRELVALLERLAIGEEDQVCFVGDVVARGPDSLGVMTVIRDISGQSVVGNHEAKLLQARAAQRRGRRRARSWG